MCRVASIDSAVLYIYMCISMVVVMIGLVALIFPALFYSKMN